MAYFPSGAPTADAPFVLVDGYKRIRALQRLARDTVRATLRAIEEARRRLGCVVASLQSHLEHLDGRVRPTRQSARGG